MLTKLEIGVVMNIWLLYAWKPTIIFLSMIQHLAETGLLSTSIHLLYAPQNMCVVLWCIYHTSVQRISWEYIGFTSSASLPFCRRHGFPENNLRFLININLRWNISHAIVKRAIKTVFKSHNNKLHSLRSWHKFLISRKSSNSSIYCRWLKQTYLPNDKNPVYCFWIFVRVSA